jgi:NAD(P)-dependent dehydrogenase (short-subunit alcohol dehydrogenase family)
MTEGDRTVLITGCSTGIGRAAAKAFLEDGWTTYATARTPSDIEDLGEMGCETAELDVTVQEHVDGVVDRIVEEQGRIDCLVNNAGTAQAGALEEVPIEAMEWQFDVNVFGPHRLARAVLPHMREQGDGTIINVSSVMGLVAMPGMGPYAGTKHAMEGLTDALRTEVAPFGIDVFLVEPGWIKTPIGDKGEDAIRENESEDSPYGPLHDNAVAYRDLMMETFSGGLEDVATTLVRAANSPDPKARYVVKTNGRLLALNQYLPDSLYDCQLERIFWGPLARVWNRVT